jgi:hypothetical protein
MLSGRDLPKPGRGRKPANALARAKAGTETFGTKHKEQQAEHPSAIYTNLHSPNIQKAPPLGAVYSRQERQSCTRFSKSIRNGRHKRLPSLLFQKQ